MFSLLTLRTRTAALSFLLSLVWSPCVVGQALPQTVAESSQYTKTSRHTDVQAYLNQLAAQSPKLNRLEIGWSVEKRPLSAMILAEPPVKAASDLSKDPRLVVLLLGNIHAGECAGKEAILALLRDLSGHDPDGLLKHFVILAVPNFNVDANEQQGRQHRPGQIGPREGMGLRNNSQGLDLNRDFIKLESPEVRSLTQFMQQWNPHVFIDTHTTNGSRHRYHLTYDVPHNPAAPTALRNWLRRDVLPKVTRDLAARDINTFFYGNFNQDHTRWTTFGHEPRYSTEYFGLLGGVSVLAEAYSYVPYQKRVESHYEFISAVLRQLSKDTEFARTLVEKSGTFQGKLSIRAKNSAYRDKVTVEGYRRPATPLPKPPGPAKPTDTPEDYSLDYHANYQTTLAVSRPYAYLLNRQEARAAARLMMHGIQVHQLTQPLSFPVERQRITKIQTLPGAVSGQRLTSLATEDVPVSDTVPTGTYVIYSDQPRSRLLTYLLEPRSDDGLSAWNFFRHALEERGFHPVSRVTQATELVTTQLKTAPRSSLLTLDRIYGPRGRIPFGGSFPLSLRWLPKSSSYQWRQGADNYHVSAETGARSPVDKGDPTLVRQALKNLLGITKKEASALANGPSEKSPDGKITLYRYQQDLVLYRGESAVARRLTNDKQTKRLATFSPDSQNIAFIRNHNLIVVPTAGGPEIAITSDGSPQQLYGYLDWVYQEELYGRGNFRGFWWSPDSLHIALLHLDETPVSRYTVADHLAYREKSNTAYYPKAGDPLPRVQLGIAGLDKQPPRWISLDRFGDDRLISHVSWGPQGHQLYAQVQDRAQTWLELLRINAEELQAHSVLRETTPAWVQSPGSPVFLRDGSFLWLSESTGYRHIQHVTNRRRRRIRLITSGAWEVQKILGVDKQQKFVYFLGNRETGREAHAYRVPVAGGTVRRLTTEPGNHAVRFNDTFTHFLDYVSGIHRPISVYLHRADGTRLRTIAPNLVDHLEYYSLNKPEFVTLAARDQHPLTGILIKPPEFDPGKRYPVLCHVYGGPQAPVARNRWAGSTYLWHQYLAQQGYVIWIPDNRASTHEGVKGTWPIHLNMGHVELRDLEDGIKWLTDKKWIDPDRIGIWGWSYGGYLTSYALTHSKLFKVGIAGAPVTDWRNYDAIYTERYMGLPSKNPKGYLAASPVHAAKDLHGRLLLIHGSLDDNVHLSNTLQFANALQNAGKQFQLMIYPNNKHGITRSQQSRHLRDLMTQFILDHL